MIGTTGGIGGTERAAAIMLEGNPHADDPVAYADGCGLCMMQKPPAAPPA